MESHFKSALEQVKAEESVVSRTYFNLKNAQNQPNPTRTSRMGSKGNQLMRKYVMAALLALVVIGGGAGAYGYYKVPVSYLSLDVNPSIELGVSLSGDVVEVEGINEDGKTVVEGLDIIGTDVDEATQAIVESASDKNFIEEDGSSVVSITSETDSDKAAEKLTIAAENGIQKALQTKQKNAEIIKSKIAIERRIEAKELGISPGKLHLIQKLQKLDPAVTVEQYKDAKVKEIMKAIKDKRTEAKEEKKQASEEQKDSNQNEAQNEELQPISEEQKEEIKQKVQDKKEEVKQKTQERKEEVKQKIEERKEEVKQKIEEKKNQAKENGNQKNK